MQVLQNGPSNPPKGPEDGGDYPAMDGMRDVEDGERVCGARLDLGCVLNGVPVVQGGLGTKTVKGNHPSPQRLNSLTYSGAGSLQT
jgi:hypothetical protein